MGIGGLLIRYSNVHTKYTITDVLRLFSTKHFPLIYKISNFKAAIKEIYPRIPGRAV
jgi:hypothetical protein